ncbi:MAG: DNA replication and repair protein RecF [Candidatus Caldatribacteriota bacterium]
MNCWKLQKLQAQNFRNLDNSIFSFVEGINCIFGNNGNGKTNLLEAVFYLTNKKSFRKNTSFSQMINIEGEDPQIIIQAVFGDDKNNITSYSLRENEGSQERYWDNLPAKGKTPISSVFINPFDSYQFHNSSTFRRQWLDSHLSMVDKDYKKTLSAFTKSMRFRNSLLPLGTKSQLQLRAIDEQIAEQSAIITQKRVNFTQELTSFITPCFSQIFAEEHQLALELDSLFVHWDAQKIYDYYRHQENHDYKSGITQVGIHRDDVVFYFDGLNAFEFCSLGQQKMGFLSLIFAYIELFRYKFNSYPIVLIDDVSGELDSQRWKNLIQYLETKMFQVLITTANENFGKELEKIPQSKKFFITQGKLV